MCIGNHFRLVATHPIVIKIAPKMESRSGISLKIKISNKKTMSTYEYAMSEILDAFSSLYALVSVNVYKKAAIP